MSLEQDFLRQIADSVFDSEKDEEKRAFFLRRFDPENRKKINKEIAALVKEDLGAYAESKKGETLRLAIALLDETYKKEMNADKCILPEGQKGKKDIWKIVYQWLWETKFPRWAYPVIWKKFQEKAQKVSFEWLNFFKEGEEMLAYNSRLKLPQPQKKPSIIVNEPQLMSVDLPDFNGYLLLLNKGSDYVVCPSKAFATNYQINGKLTLPQPETPAKKQGVMFTYEDLRIEEFTAIALDRPLNLTWLDVNNTEEMAAHLTPDRMMELWRQLEGRNDWRVYYEAFEVVEE
jgi:hypothetical protein